LPTALRARLDRIAAGAERKASPKIKPGARLLREWNGTTHVVDVLPDGFLWNGTRHRSLSAIARAITGARWSGPRFFGIVAAVSRADEPGGHQPRCAPKAKWAQVKLPPRIDSDRNSAQRKQRA
jgi:hypothetical protein